MMKLWLGVSAKATILVSHMHPNNVISRAYPNYMETDMIEGLGVVSEAPKPIYHEDKVVVCFLIPQKETRQKKLIVGCFVGLSMLLKRDQKKDSSLHQMVVVT